ncbi:hypothetical protein [Paraburkholderia domus]|uniref:hypothetical protein n=1 Tax=Paraburkholderia domus TaxID=2793075 RepID=UPI001911A9CA|nr:hypothetical protein [Paraburkholderia domus]MBK5049320.1 hypothetical protein [Burkholderia sp. R-70006]MBK5180696.1 hypothetical protein [Burkholderia sp. R-69749]CAE6779416.1 hypothetical protein R70006_04324 [Paraburkholderia domus]CAE6803547.1 hypothetical protein R69749_02723 [Paraburkholderia domus]
MQGVVAGFAGSGGIRVETRDASTAVPSCCLMYWCRMARGKRLKIYSAALLFSGGIKEMLAAIGNSTKRGQKKGLFVM